MSSAQSSDLLWLDAFPWLGRALRRSDVSRDVHAAYGAIQLWASPLSRESRGSANRIFEITDLYVANSGALTLGDGFPAIPLETELTLADLPGLSPEVCGGKVSTAWEDLADRTIFDLQSRGHLDPTWTRLFLGKLIDLNIVAAIELRMRSNPLATLRECGVRLVSSDLGRRVNLPIPVLGHRGGTTFATWKQRRGAGFEKRRAWDCDEILVIDGRGINTTIAQLIADTWHVAPHLTQTLELTDGKLYVFAASLPGEPSRIELEREDLDSSFETIGNWLADETDEPDFDDSPRTGSSSVAEVEPKADLLSQSLTERVEHLLGRMSERELRILQGRVLSRPKETLDEIGREYGVTRERVRQIETQVSAMLSIWMSSDPVAVSFSGAIRSVTGTINSLDRLLEAFPGLRDVVRTEALPTWYVFDQFDDSFESDGSWVAVPSLGEVARRFDAEFDAFTGSSAYVPIAELESGFAGWGSAPFTDLIAWAESRGYRRVGDILVGPDVRAMHDLAVIALEASGHPMSLESLHAAAAPDRSIRSLANQLGDDKRVKRIGNGMWALATWEGEEYSSIRDAVIARVDEQGSASLSELIAELPAKFGVSPASVRAYASNWPLRTVGDLVRRAERATPKARPLERTRGVYFVDGGFAWRFTATSDHLRGSGSTFPTALAGALGNTYGNTMDVPVLDSNRTILLRWNGNQATISTIRAILNDLGITEGDHVVMEFIGGTVRVRRLGTMSEQLTPEGKLKFLLLIEVDQSVNRRSVAARAGLARESLWHEIIETFEARRERDVVEAITEMNASYTD